MNPIVSVIITTHARPHLVGRAVRSALGQTLEEIEVIVVQDGPDPDTLGVLNGIDDPRLRVVTLTARKGQAAAINDGATHVRGEFVATLDDDDEWLPGKLATQLQAARASGIRMPLVGCYFLVTFERGEQLRPLRPPAANEPACDYLFRRRRLAHGDGLLPTSMFFAPAELFRRVPFNERIPRHCDMDWLIRASQEPGCSLVMPKRREALAIWHTAGSDRLSKDAHWRNSWQWITECRPIVTPRAYAGFLLTWVGLNARRHGELEAIPLLLRDAFRHGRPGWRDLLLFAGFWLMPMGLRERWSHTATATRGGNASP